MSLSVRSTSIYLPRRCESGVAEALERVGLTGMEERVPFHLSGGEKRRVALAGVLAMRPSILLLDEPSMYLDPRGRRELIQLLHTLGGTRMIASHDLELILQTCERVLLLDRGRLMADGPAPTDPERCRIDGGARVWRCRTACGSRRLLDQKDLA